MEQSAIAQSLIDAMAILATKENENAAVYAVWDYLNDAKRYLDKQLAQLLKVEY